MGIVALPFNPYIWFDMIRPMPTGRGMIFIAGMPKSGTTVITNLLGAATRQMVCSDPFHKLDEKNVKFRSALFNGQLSLETLWRRQRSVFAGSIIKDPNFPFLLSQLKRLFPEAILVSIIRDPRDNIRSILNRLGLSGNPHDVNLKTTGIAGTWLDVLTGQVPQLPGENYVEILAWRWRKSAEAFLEQRKSCVQIRYEDFNKSKSAAIYDLANQLGYSELSNIENLVDVQYQHKGDASVNWEEFFGEKQLAVIDRVTGSVLREFGYEPYTTNS